LENHHFFLGLAVIRFWILDSPLIKGGVGGDGILDFGIIPTHQLPEIRKKIVCCPQKNTLACDQFYLDNQIISNSLVI
jgi:hypothetical protein